MISFLGIALIFAFRELKIGLSTIAIRVLWFLLMIFVIIPHFSANNENWAMSFYSVAIAQTSTISSVPQLLGVVQKYFFAPNSLDYYSALFKPFTFMPLLGLPWLLLAIPEFTVNLFSTNAWMQTVTLYYDSGIIPFLVISTIFGILYLVKILRLVKPLKIYTNYILSLIIIVMIVSALRVNYHYSPLPTTPSCWCLVYQVDKDDIEFEKVLRAIPASASITASSEVRAHLTRRKDSFTLPNQVDTADYVAMIDQNRAVGGLFTERF